jgi:hypothetical protein
MAHKKKKKISQQEMVIKAFRKANREIELERNGGRWIATTQFWKNKKCYDRKRDRKIDSDGLFFVCEYFFKRCLSYQ